MFSVSLRLCGEFILLFQQNTFDRLMVVAGFQLDEVNAAGDRLAAEIGAVPIFTISACA